MIYEYSMYVSISHRISMYPTLGAVWWPEGGMSGVVVIISLKSLLRNHQFYFHFTNEKKLPCPSKILRDAAQAAGNH